MTVKLRYKEPDGDTSTLVISVSVPARPTGSSPALGFAAAVAEFGMLLRDSEFKGTFVVRHRRARSPQRYKGSGPARTPRRVHPADRCRGKRQGVAPHAVGHSRIGIWNSEPQGMLMEHATKSASDQQRPRPAAECTVTRGIGATFIDNRPAASAQRELTEVITSAPRVLARQAATRDTRNSPRVVAQRRQFRGMFDPVLQREGGKEGEELLPPPPKQSGDPES